MDKLYRLFSKDEVKTMPDWEIELNSWFKHLDTPSHRTKESFKNFISELTLLYLNDLTEVN